MRRQPILPVKIDKISPKMTNIVIDIVTVTIIGSV